MRILSLGQKKKSESPKSNRGKYADVNFGGDRRVRGGLGTDREKRHGGERNTKKNRPQGEQLTRGSVLGGLKSGIRWGRRADADAKGKVLEGQERKNRAARERRGDDSPLWEKSKGGKAKRSPK